LNRILIKLTKSFGAWRMNLLSKERGKDNNDNTLNSLYFTDN
jgi:hypothetical protein